MTASQRNLIVALLLAVLLAGGWWWSNREPTYGGFTISEWIRLGIDGKVSETKVQRACWEMGPEAIPHLSRMLTTHTPNFTDTLFHLLNQQRYIQFSRVSAYEKSQWAGKILPYLGNRATPLFPELIDSLRPKNAQHVLFTMAACGPSSLPYLHQATTHESALVRCAAIYALFQGAFDDAETIRILGICLNDKSPAVRAQSLHTLGKLTHKPNDVVPLLRTHLTNESVGSIKAATILNLKYFGRSASIALPHIREELNSQHGYVREQVVNAGVEIDPDVEAWIPVLSRLIDEDPDFQVRVTSMNTLRKLGTNAHSAVPVIQNQFRHREPQIRLAVVEALDKITQDPELIRPLLVELWRDHGLVPHTVADSAAVIKEYLRTNQTVGPKSN